MIMICEMNTYNFIYKKFFSTVVRRYRSQDIIFYMKTIKNRTRNIKLFTVCCLWQADVYLQTQRYNAFHIAMDDQFAVLRWIPRTQLGKGNHTIVYIIVV